LKKLTTHLGKGSLLAFATEGLLVEECDAMKKSLFLRVILMEMQDEVNEEKLP